MNKRNCPTGPRRTPLSWVPRMLCSMWIWIEIYINIQSFICIPLFLCPFFSKEVSAMNCLVSWECMSPLHFVISVIPSQIRELAYQGMGWPSEVVGFISWFSDQNILSNFYRWIVERCNSTLYIKKLRRNVSQLLSGDWKTYVCEIISELLRSKKLISFCFW